MFRKIIFILFIFIVGGLGGLFLPRLIGKWWPNASFVSGNQTVIENKTEQIVLGEKDTLAKAIQKNSPALVNITSFGANNAVLATGAGFLVSSDGLVLTRAENVSLGASRVSLHMNNADVSASVMKTSQDNGLVLLKADASNLPVVSFAEDVPDRTGTTVVLLGTKQGSSSASPILYVNEGIIKSIDGDLLNTTMQETFRFATGAPLVGLDGAVVGIASVNSSGYVFGISVDAIKKFLQ